MCGRYVLLDEQENEEMRSILRQVESKGIKFGEIYPTNPAPVLLAGGVEVFTWGFPNVKNKGAIINARSETAREKRIFKEAVARRRCVIPSMGFYEWKGKIKYHFILPGSPVLYMAGIYGEFGGDPRFVVLTTKANASAAEIHDRMPLVLEKGSVGDWLGDDAAAMRLLSGVPPMLERAAQRRTPEETTLF